MKPKIIAEDVSKRDARKLAEWWNANTEHYHFVRPHPDRPKRHQVVRQ